MSGAQPTPPGVTPPARSRRIYLAGPTVFFRDADVAFQRLEVLCHTRHLTPVRPADPIDGHGQLLGGAQASAHLFRANTARIRQAQGVLADLRPFRGALEPDSGTVFEVGFAHALGLPVAAVLAETHDWGQRVREVCGVGPPNTQGLAMDARYDLLIEDFGGPLNLMLSESCRVFARAEEALDWLQGCLAAQDSDPC